MENISYKRAAAIGAALLSISATACLKDARQCTSDSDCFGAEQCQQSTCQQPAVIVTEADMQTSSKPDQGTTPTADMAPRQPDDRIAPLQRERYLVTERLDANSVPTKTPCHLRIDTKQRLHATYLVTNARSDDSVRYQLRADGQTGWKGITYMEEFAFFSSPHLAIDSQDQAHLCAIEAIAEELRYLSPSGDTLLSQSVPIPENTTPESCAIAASASGLHILYTATNKQDTAKRHLWYAFKASAQGSSWQVSPLDQAQHDVASAPTLTLNQDGTLSLMYHAAQSGQSYWRSARWPSQRAPATNDLTTKRTTVGTPLPFIQHPPSPQTKTHTLLHTDDFSGGESIQTITYWEDGLDDLVIEGTVSPAANALSISSKGQPSILFNASDGALYLAEADPQSWVFWTLDQADNNTYSDCAAIVHDAQDNLHILYQHQPSSGQDAIHYQQLKAP